MPDDLPPDPQNLEPFTVSRRAWLGRVAGVSTTLGLAAVGSHRRLVPSLGPEPDLVPGVSTWYATSCRECPAGCGMLVRNREGRAVKCEGNPDHPISQGRLCARGQAALQGLYDPDRLRGPLHQGQPISWDAALQALGEVLRPLRGRGRVALISDLQSGSLATLIRRWLALFGSDRYLVYEPLSYDATREANQRLFERPIISVPSLDKADFILSFGADFLETWLSPVQFTRQFAANRGARFVYVGPRVSMTAANADERILVRPGDERFVALAVLQVLKQESLIRASPLIVVPRVRDYAPDKVGPRVGIAPETLRRVALDFGRARSPVALSGDPLASGRAAVETALAATQLNLSVGPLPFDVGAAHALSDVASAGEVGTFLEALRSDPVDVLLVVGANPAYSTGEDFASAAQAAKHVVTLTPFADETAARSQWVLPMHTPLESWGDYEPQTGILNAMQPVMGPPYDTRSVGDALLALAQAAGHDPPREFGAPGLREYLFARWARQGPVEELLQRGVRSGPPAPEPLPGAEWAPRLADFGQPDESAGLRLHMHPSATLFDGRGANRSWLQEHPDPMTKVAWSSWVEMHPEDAAQAGLQAGDTAQVTAGRASYAAPVVITPGVARGTVAVPLGQGHAAYGRYAQGVGANAFALPPGGGLTVAKARHALPLPCADGSPYQHGRELARVTRDGETPEHEELRLPLPEGYTREGDMLAGHPHRDHRWAMAVDLNRCTGCGACAVACQAENNIGVVGSSQFARHRMMAWIRVDRYYDWSDPTAPVLFLPLMCQHCDAAPCEPVCPVFAAAHSEEGLNMQVYNRCIGTRYCANNCPYKVRRFNWLDWEWPEPLNWQANPDVTVRSRGVMEKCTFCIQRIREAEVRARREDRPLRDGEVMPACAQTCPAEALTFGDLMDPSTRIARLVAEDRRAYQLLGELNTKPAVFYLSRRVEGEERRRSSPPTYGTA